VTIGISLSLSGDFSSDGQNFQQGYDLWAKYQNAHGGLLGHKVVLKILSDASNPTQVVTNYEDLISSDHVPLILGPYSTLLTVPAQKVAHRFGYAFIAGAGGGTSSLCGQVQQLLRRERTDHRTAVPLRQVARIDPGEPATDYGRLPHLQRSLHPAMVQAAQAVIQKAGVKTVYSKVFPAEVTDFLPIADAVASSHAQVVVLGSVDVPTVSAFMQAFEQAHYTPRSWWRLRAPTRAAPS